MSIKSLWKPMVIGGLIVMSASCSSTDPLAENKKIVVDAFNTLFVDFDQEETAKILTEDYIQHNMAVPTGRDAIVGALPVLQETGLTPTVHRVIAEGDLVAIHTTYTNADFFGAPTLVAFDIFRVEDGLVAEHWDNLQAPPEVTVSGRSMTDGPTEVVDHDKTAANKAVVEGFLRDVFRDGQFDKASDYIISTPGGYRQHNGLVGDGLDALLNGLAAMAEAGQGFSFSKVHMVIAEGNFVLSVSEGGVGDTPAAFYDLWRVEDGLIVEHWDVIQSIPEESAHSNGKF